MNLTEFSVIIPVHNKKPHVARAIQSVLNQDFEHFELILVDDASTDDSSEEMERFADSRIRFFKRNEPGIGGYQARNLGIQKANSDWITFLDADDEWFPHHLARIYELRNQYPSASFFSSGWLIADDTHAVKNPFLRKNEKCGVISRIDLKRYLEVHVSGVDLVHTDVAVINKGLLERIGGFPLPTESCKRSGDGQTWLRAMLAGAEMVWSPYIGAVYYQDAVNMVTKKQAYTIEENGLVRFIDDTLKSEKYSPVIRELLKQYRQKRVISALFQDARNGCVSAKTIQKAVREKKLDLRLMFVFSGYFFPGFTQRIIGRLLG